mgnify:CR=1 FL=1
MLGQLVDGMDFYSTIVDMGEEITFLTDPPIKQYASITMHRTTNTTDGAYWYYGAMTFDSVEQQNTLVGEYFTRQTNSGPKNILTSVMPENTTPRVGTVYTVECNETVDIISHYEGTGEYNDFGEEIMEPVYLAKGIDCYMTMTLERLNNETAGSFIQTISTITLPAKTTISEQNIVLKNSFIFDEKQKKNVYQQVKYRVESIDTSMMDVVDGKIVGVLKCLLTEDKR